MVILPSLEKLVLSSLGCFTNVWQSIAFEDSFCKLESIEIKGCGSLQKLVSPEHLQLRNVKIVRNSSRKLALRLPFLTNVETGNCDELTSLFPDAIARTLFELENLHISSCKKLKEVVSTQKEEMMMFNKLRSLKLESLKELKSFSTGSIEYYFPFLQKLHISECSNFKSFIMSPTDANVNSTPLFHDKVIILNLEELHIKGLGLEELLHHDFPPRLFCKLKELEVEACDKLSDVIPPFILPNMQSLESLTVKNCKSVRVIFKFHEHTTKILENLQKLTVKDCESMEQVVDFESGQDCSTREANKMILRQLSNLVLSGLPKLSSFCSKLMTEWPSLVEMKAEGCNAVEAFAVDSKQHLKALFWLEKVAFPKMKSLNISHMLKMKELWSINEEGIDSKCSSEAFFELEELEIDNCGSLKTIFPSKMLRGFSKLESLTVRDCNSLEQVFQVQGSRMGKECNNNNSFIKIPFSLMKLRNLRLPAMKDFWNAENNEGKDLAFGVLKDISIANCYSLKHLFPASMARCLGQINFLWIKDCNDMEEIVQRKGCSIDDDHDDREHHQFVPNLKVTDLWLENLPRLNSFIPCEITWISGCPKAKVHPSSVQEMSGGCKIINSVEKVNIPTCSLRELRIDMGGLQEIRLLDGLANLSSLCIVNINHAEAESFPWKNLLERLHNLETLEFKSVSIEAFVMEEALDIVQHLTFSLCDSLKHLFVAPASFCNLASIEVGLCSGMEYLLTSSAARCLNQLSNLKVEFCSHMREIVRAEQVHDGNGGGGGVDEICFPRLQILKLYFLRELGSLCSSTSCSFQFPRLESIILGEAGELKTFFEGDFSAPLLHTIYTFKVPEGIMKTKEIKQKKILDEGAFLDIYFS